MLWISDYNTRIIQVKKEILNKHGLSKAPGVELIPLFIYFTIDFGVYAILHAYVCDCEYIHGEKLLDEVQDLKDPIVGGNNFYTRDLICFMKLKCFPSCIHRKQYWEDDEHDPILETMSPSISTHCKLEWNISRIYQETCNYSKIIARLLWLMLIIN